MEYYGKILCISYNDLTYDDRPVMVNGKADYSRSRTLKGVHPSTLSEEELAPIMSIPNYKKLAAKEKINVVRSGRGLGGYVLVEIATMPLRFQKSGNDVSVFFFKFFHRLFDALLLQFPADLTRHDVGVGFDAALYVFFGAVAESFDPFYGG